jgi:hypothetical protein
MVAMTSYSAGRVRICWRKASAMTSLMMMSFLAGLGVFQGVPRAAVEGVAPKCSAATS